MRIKTQNEDINWSIPSRARARPLKRNVSKEVDKEVNKVEVVMDKVVDKQVEKKVNKVVNQDEAIAVGKELNEIEAELTRLGLQSIIRQKCS